MKIELKNVKTHEAMSHETTCFSASIYLEGKRIGVVRNKGCGGCNEYTWTNNTAGRKVEAWAETQETDYEFEKLDQIIDDLMMKSFNETAEGNAMTAAEGIASLIFEYKGWGDGERPHEEDCMELGRQIMQYLKEESNGGGNQDSGNVDDRKQELIEEKIAELECSISVVRQGDDEKEFEMEAGWYIHWGVVGGMIDDDGNETNYSSRFETEAEADRELRKAIWDGFLAGNATYGTMKK